MNNEYTLKVMSSCCYIHVYWSVKVSPLWPPPYPQPRSDKHTVTHTHACNIQCKYRRPLDTMFQNLFKYSNPSYSIRFKQSYLNSRIFKQNSFSVKLFTTARGYTHVWEQVVPTHPSARASVFEHALLITEYEKSLLRAESRAYNDAKFENGRFHIVTGRRGVCSKSSTKYYI